MVLFKLLPLFGALLGFVIVWGFGGHRNFETRRKRAEMLLILTPFVLPVFLLIVHLISR